MDFVDEQYKVRSGAPKEEKQDQQQIGEVSFRFIRVDFNKLILNVVAGTYIFFYKGSFL